MAKIRVHEIAKEYDVTAKEVINFLHGHNIEVTNLSSLEDNAVSLIRGKYGKQDSTDDKKERPKKKASISAVYNPQNSKMGNRRPNNGNRNERNGDRPQRNNGDRPRNNNGDRPQRNNGDRPRYDGDRPQRNNGDRSRYDGERQQRNNGDRSRYDGDRQQRNNGDRPQRRFGDRPQRQENGDRNGRYERKDNNNQKGFQGNRGGGNSFGGNRNNRQDGQNRSRETRGRLDQEISRMNRDSAKAPIEELRGKENTHANKKKNKQDYERKNRKQEQYVNLEKKTGHKKRNAQPQPQAEKKADEVRSIALPEVMTVRELAERIGVPASKVVEKLFMQGILATVNQEIDYEKAEEIALEFNCIAEKEEKVDVIAELLKEEEEDENTLISRPPVVCVMGHVDHGKTSLLDAIRETHVTDREAGGITQHIGASVVKINGQKITFLDTPGHEAFTAMRMRGANATDIAILVVAADDGIMPQTVEAISHAKAAGIEIIVAINKIDKESANIDYVKQGLAEQGLIPEDWGGSTICVPVSARTGEGITELLEMVLLTADILELNANPKRNARGLVIEAQLDKGRGVVATVLVQKGTLKVGEPIAAGSSYGKVRAMIDDKGRRVKEAGPSTPVEILGLNNVPNAGEVFVACDSEKDARSFAETFVSQNREKMLEETRSRMSLDDLFSQIQTGNLKELELIVKADVQGSVEAVKQSLMKLSNEEVMIKVVHGGVGAINESDVILASASNAIIIGFNVRPDAMAKAAAEREKVDMRLYRVIYNAIEDIEAAIKGMLDPVYREKVIGHVEVRQIYKASGVGTIAGCYVLDGTITKDAQSRIVRDGIVIYEGELASLKRFKDDVKEVKAGFECGIVFEKYNDIKEGDQIEAFVMEEIPR